MQGVRLSVPAPPLPLSAQRHQHPAGCPGGSLRPGPEVSPVTVGGCTPGCGTQVCGEKEDLGSACPATRLWHELAPRWVLIPREGERTHPPATAKETLRARHQL